MFFVYLLASKPHGTLYARSTSDLVRRVWEHKVKAAACEFIAKYGVDRFVWLESRAIELTSSSVTNGTVGPGFHRDSVDIRQ